MTISYEGRLRIFAVGLILGAFCFFSDFIVEYGEGGRPYAKDENNVVLKFFPEEADYILVNNSNGLKVTPISENFFKLINKANFIQEIIILVALPFIFFGLINYWTKVTKWHNSILVDWPINTFRIWRALIIPKEGDPSFTCYAKLFFLLMFLSYFVVDTRTIIYQKHSEYQFLLMVALLYIVNSVISIIIVFVINKMRKSGKSVT